MERGNQLQMFFEKIKRTNNQINNKIMVQLKYRLHCGFDFSAIINIQVFRELVNKTKLYCVFSTECTHLISINTVHK